MTTIADKWNLHADHFWLRGRRPDRPVCFNTVTGMWNVYGYAEALRVIGEPRTFSSNTGRVIPERDEFSEGNLVQMDPPLHGKLRRLVSHAFTPKVVADLEPRIDAVARELLDAVGNQGRMELIGDLAYPLPVIVIAELLGVPADDRFMFKAWVDKLFSSSEQFSLTNRTEEQERRFEEITGEVRKLTAYLGEHAAERRRRPRADLLTRLVEAEVDGVRLTEAEVVNFANLLLIAGHITTTLLLGNTVLCLDAHPEQRARVRADRSLVPGAIEESLRMLSPFAVLARVNEEEVELGGARVPPEQLLMVWLSAANRDPAWFPDPDVFDPARDPNPHLAFGRGIHFCLGAPLARLEGRIALNILLDRYPGLRTDPGESPTFSPSPNMTGVTRLPLLLDD
ncbi:cytochrome P450 [Rhizohabitans arisaemae]|uniref:cytochrome P450 n=1 Tax=Rhizohabitans arisaemae TaxID=2720610 RepID=UPI0024B0CC7B|nr:cytochrome P450 [Rhizohabitans arisaemae]